MVEGPKYHRHAELLRLLLSRRLKAVLRVESAQQGAGLRALLGCRVLEVFAVGKELFIVFALKWDPDELRRGGSIRLHFGHGGGYLVEQMQSDRSSHFWGPKADGGGHCRDSTAALALEFGPDERDCGLKFSLWNDLGSSFGLCSHEYLRSVEARSCFDINSSWERFAAEDACRIFRESEELVVDLIMDQSRLPGVGNIIKCEGLFAAHIFPLRRSCELSVAEWMELLSALHRFSDQWYQHCQQSANGQQMGCCHLMRVYGHWNCSECQHPVSLIKEGKRQRITYFCPMCQPHEESRSIPRSHRCEMLMTLTPCHCGLQPAVLQVRAGNYAGAWDDRRPYLSCPRRRGSRYDDGGCGLPGPWDGCGFHVWLDEVVTMMPECHCKKPALLRRVVGLRENGRHFFRCAQRGAGGCRFRCWLTFNAPVQRRWRRGAARAEGEQRAPQEDSSSPQTSSSEKGDVSEVTTSKRTSAAAGYKTKRWLTR